MSADKGKCEGLTISNVRGWLVNYIEVLKPRETVLLTFIGACAALIASAGQPSIPVGTVLLVTLAILMGCGAANGLTNYFDWELDAKMERVKHRPIPSRRIYPPQKVLPWVVSLAVAGLFLAGHLHYLCFVFGAVGLIIAVTWRKRITCALPQGAIAGCAPVAIGYVAVSKGVDLTLLLLCILIALWTPLHVWSVMLANRDDYRQAGITYFPISSEVSSAIKVLLLFAALLLASSLALYFYTDLGLLYLAIAIAIGIPMVAATARLLFSGLAGDAWRVYKMTAFPYLGIMFLVMVLDLWLL